ncbi:MAG: substrate-binding periplasmic protein [Magnetospirillum sp.]
MKGLALALLCLATLRPMAAAAETVIVALTDSTPNFSMHMPDGSFRGINVEVAGQVCQRLQLTCKFQPMPLAALVAHIRDDKAQIGFGNLIKTAEREKIMLFSRPYWRSTTAFVGHPELAGIPMAQLVKGRKVAVQEGSRQAKWLTDTFGSTYTPVPRPTIFDVVATLPLKQADLALAPMMTVHPFLVSPEGADFGFVSEPIDSGWPVHVVISREHPDLQTRVDDALNQMMQDGTLGRIVRAWVPFDIF